MQRIKNQEFFHHQLDAVLTVNMVTRGWKFFIISKMFFLIPIAIYYILITSIRNGNAIIKGTRATEGQFKYMAAIFINGYLNCGGAILDERNILTAAHCVHRRKPQMMKIVVGAGNYKLEGRIVRDVKTVHVYNKYIPKQIPIPNLQYQLPIRHQQPKHDIAVLTLTEPLSLEGNIMAVNLTQDCNLPYCEPILYAGWGRQEDDVMDEYLRYMEMFIISPRRLMTYNFIYFENKFYTISFSRNAVPGPGDSGDPAVSNNIVYGVLSMRQVMQRAAVLTEVCHYYDFIVKIMEETSTTEADCTEELPTTSNVGIEKSKKKCIIQ
ncbi:hypodermin-A-like isoform X2 [Diachasmimorpha longicaudata]|uniref:hypodermin-A-like isoform X2 n=1 Tax=Diachasmimorpha longicaudata TaxID=58733 RepID=UPI0030B8C072